MNETTLHLTPVERDLVVALREIPDSPWREYVLTLVNRILRMARTPSCPESQADGVPCGRVDGACDSCERTVASFQGLFGLPM